MAAQVGSATLPLLSARRRRPRDALHQILIGQLRNRDWYLLSERRSRWPGRSAGCRPVPNNRARQKARQPASSLPRTRRCYGAGGEEMAPSIAARKQLMECPMPQPNDLSRSLVALDQNSTIIAVVEMSQSSWLV